MLEIDYGLAGSGKSRYIKNMLAEKLDQGEKLMILVPDQYSFITERSVLEDFGAQKSANIQVIWFHNLARLITEKYGGVKPQLLDNSGKAILMSKAVGEVQERLDFYKKQATKPDFIASMLNLSAEIKFSKTEPQALLEAARQTGSVLLEKKLEEIVCISNRYDALVEESYLNPDDVLSEVNALLQTHRFFEGYTVAIDGFGFFDKQKIDIIASIIEQSRATYVTLCTDSLEPAEFEGDKFAAVKRTAARLMEAARMVGKDIKTKRFDDLNSLKPEFQVLSKGIYNPALAPYEGDCESVSVVACPNIVAECEHAAYRIKKLIMSGDYRYKDIAVIVRDEETYIPLLKKAFATFDIPFFKDSRRNVSHEPLMLFCHFALKACAGGFRLDDVMSCVKSAAAGIPTEEISAFENYCLVWNINSKGKWSADFTYNPRGFTERLDEEDTAALERINQTRRKIVIPLLSFAKKAKGADIKGVSTALYELLQDVKAAQNLKALIEGASLRESDIAEEQGAVWSVLMNCLDRLVATRGEETVSLQEYMGLLDLAVGSSNIGVLPNRVDEILVGSADRIRTDLPKAAFLLGVNEGEFPKAYNDGGILNDFDRMSLLRQGIELGVNCTSMTTQERFFAYCAALAPSEYLYLSYNKSNFNGDVLAPSNLVGELLRLLPRLQAQEAARCGEEEILTRSQGFETLARLWKQDTVLRATLLELLSQEEAFAQKLSRLEQTANEAPKTIENPKVSLQLFGEAMALSPTQLETYSKCPFMYFCKYGLRASTAERAALDARTGGTLIHYVLEHIVKELGKKGITTLSFAELKEYVDKYIIQYIEQLQLPEEFLTGRFKYIVSKNRSIILATLEQMAAEMAQSDFEPSDFELRIQRGENSGYVVPLKEGKVSLGGVIDRVDTMEKGDKKYFRIIDYKTGNKDFNLGEVLYGINAQMLIYLLSLSRDTGEKYGGSTPAGLLYINATDKAFNTEHTTEEELEKQKQFRYKMKGMVLDEAEVITGMEHEPSGKFIPIEFDKSGNLGGNVVSSEQMEKIRRKLDAVIADMGNSLHEGKIDDLPFSAGSGSACDYCDFKAVCRNTGKARQAQVPKKFKDALEQLEEEEADGEI